MAHYKKGFPDGILLLKEGFNYLLSERYPGKGPESKREEFRRYLEKAGVLDSLSSVLVALYEETDKPNNALDFVKQHLGVADPETTDTETLRLELTELQQKCELLVEENKELRNRMMSYESYDIISGDFDTTKSGKARPREDSASAI